MSSRKAFTPQTTEQNYMKEEHMILTHPISNEEMNFEGNQEYVIQQNHLNRSDPMLPCFYPNIQELPLENYQNNICTDLMQQNTERTNVPENDFPFYQLENPYDNQNNISEADILNFDQYSCFPTFCDDNHTFANCNLPSNSKIDDTTDDGYYFRPNNFCNLPADQTVKTGYKMQSRPIDIQQNFHANTVLHNTSVLVPPASDRNGSVYHGQSFPDYGSTSSVPEGMSIDYNQQNLFFENCVQPQTQYIQNPSTGSAPFSIQATEDLISPSQNGFCSSHLSSTEHFHPNDARNFLNTKHSDDVFCDAPQPTDLLRNSQSYPGLNFERHQSTEIATQNILPRFSNQNVDSILQYPPQTHSNMTVASNDGSFNGSDWAPFAPSEDGVDSPLANSSLNKADERRLRNNIACKKARERRKKKKQDKEALARSLQDENIQLKRTIIDLESEVANIKSIINKYNIGAIASSNGPGQ